MVKKNDKICENNYFLNKQILNVFKMRNLQL